LAAGTEVVAASERRRTCGRSDEVGTAIPRAKWRRRRRYAGHCASSSSCDCVTAQSVTPLLLVSDVSMVASVLVMAVCERRWTCVPLASVDLIVVP
jgi:hypothetical protein